MYILNKISIGSIIDIRLYNNYLWIIFNFYFFFRLILFFYSFHPLVVILTINLSYGELEIEPYDRWRTKYTINLTTPQNSDSNSFIIYDNILIFHVSKNLQFSLSPVASSWLARVSCILPHHITKPKWYAMLQFNVFWNI